MGKDLNGKELGENIKQRLNGSYEGRYVDRHGNRRSVYSTSLAEVKRKLKAAKYDDYMYVERKTSMTVNTWFHEWLDVYKKNCIRPSTRRIYIQIYEQHIKTAFGKSKLDMIKTYDVKKLINRLDDEGLGYSTQSRVKIMLADMFDKAIMDDLIIKNPAKGVKVREKEAYDRRVLSKEEQKDFFDCCKGTYYDNLFVVAISTGMRIGEICALTWDDIDLDEKIITVSKTLSYMQLEGDEGKVFRVGPPKTKTSNRKIPITPQCEEALKKQLLLRSNIMSRNYTKPLSGFEDLLFISSKGRPLCTQTVTDAIDRIIKEINLCRDMSEQMPKFSPHCFRHTFATRCFEAGIPPKTVQVLLGHSTLDMTMNLYTHVMPEQKTDALEKLNSYYSDINNDMNKEIVIDESIFISAE